MSDYIDPNLDELEAGELAKSETIRSIVDEVQEGHAASNVDANGKAIVISAGENAFRLTKSSTKYDQHNRNVCEDEEYKWYSFYSKYLRQTINITKTELNSITVKLRNLTYIKTDVSFSIKSVETGEVMGSNIVELPAHTDLLEHEIIFDIKYLPIGDYYFIVDPININSVDLAINGDEDENIIDWNTNPIAIMYDYRGNYNKSLKESDDGTFYGPLNVNVENQRKEYYPEADLWFEEKFSSDNVYIVEQARAQILGQSVLALDTHVNILGSSEYGNRTDIVVLKYDGHYEVIEGDVWLDEEENPEVMEDGYLPIAYITTYQDINKIPLLYQDDENIDGDKETRKRDNKEEIRRLKKKTQYIMDRNSPGRMKYNFVGQEIKASGEGGDNVVITTNDKGEIVYQIQTENKTISKYWSFKDFKLSPIAGMYNSNTGIASWSNIDHSDHENGRVYLAKESDEKVTRSISLKESQKYPKYRNGKSTVRAFKIYKSRAWTSNYPSLVFNVTKKTTIKNLKLNVRHFKGMKNFRISLFKRTNKWIRKGGNDKNFFNPYNSGKVDLTKTPVNKNGTQVLKNAHNFKVNKTIPAGQYVIFIWGEPKNNSGIIYTKTYDGPKRKSFMIKYYGPYEPNTFYRKNYIKEIFDVSFNDGTQVKYKKEGIIISETIKASANSKFTSATFAGSIKVPSGCSYKVEGSIDNGPWRAFTNKKLTFTSGGTQFKWRITLNGNGDSTPIIKFNSTKNYALRFNLSQTTSIETPEQINTIKDVDFCLTTKTFIPKDILKETLGDEWLKGDEKFESYEFARIFAEENDGNLVTDIYLGDEMYEDSRYWSTIITDLKLSDFSQTSVDYSNYEGDVEYDENNYRFKLETDKMYNDSDVLIETGIEGWTDINAEPIPESAGIIYGYSDANPMFGDKTAMVKFENAFNNTDKIFFGKKIPNGLDLTKYKTLVLNLKPNVDIPAGSLDFIISLNSDGAISSIADGVAINIDKPIFANQNNTILIDIQNYSYGLGNVQSLGFIINSQSEFIFNPASEFMLNYISGQITNIIPIIPKGSKWNSIASGSNTGKCTCCVVAGKTRFRLGDITTDCSSSTSQGGATMNLNSGKLAKLPISNNINDLNIIKFRLSTTGPIVKGVFYIDLCADEEGDHIIESIPIPTLLTSGYDLTTNVFKKVKNIGNIKSVILRTTGTGGTDGSGNTPNAQMNQRFTLQLDEMVGYTAESIPAYHKWMKLKLYSELENQTFKPPNIRKIGCVFTL